MDPQFGREMVGACEDGAVSAGLACKGRHQLIVVQPVVIVPGERMEPRQAQRGHCGRSRIRGILDGATMDLPPGQTHALVQVCRKVDESSSPFPEMTQCED